MKTNANVVTVIDRSISMMYEGYVNITKRDASAFICSAIAGDAFGIVAFDMDPKIIDPTSGTDPVIVDPQGNVLKEASSLINAIEFDGDGTNIGGGILSGTQILKDQASPRAMVLLTDGYQNYGTEPLTVLPPFPVYTCAMGPDADKNLLKEIADLTKGQAYVAPYPSTMMRIFNEIRAQPQYVSLLLNDIQNIAAQDYRLLPVYLTDNNVMAQFNVVWDDDSVAWTASPNPGTNEISVTLVQPDYSIVKQPAMVENGYCIFNVPSPALGEWQIQIIAGAVSQTLIVISGAFEFPSDPGNAIALEVSAPATGKAGEALRFSAVVKDQGQTVTGLRMTALIEQPGKTKAEITEQYAAELKAVVVEEDKHPKHLDENDMRIAQLRASMMHQKDILEPTQRPGILTTSGDGTHHLTYSDTLKPGTYNVQINVSGHSPISNAPFQRSCLTSVEVV